MSFKSFIVQLRKNPHLRYGLPFVTLVVGAPFLLKDIQSVRYEYRKQKTVTKEFEQAAKARNFQVSKDVVAEDVHEKYMKKDYKDDYEIVRGPRPWEDQGEDAPQKKNRQVEVDHPQVQKELGPMQMQFVKKAEQINRDRAGRHRRFRRSDVLVGGTCLAMVIGIYCYTIVAIKQEKFLDDFEMPDPLTEEQK